VRKELLSSPLEIKAAAFGADYLLSVAGWILKNQPRDLQRLRTQYRRVCVNLLRQIERAQSAAN
jgi:hypothetical protein